MEARSQSIVLAIAASVALALSGGGGGGPMMLPDDGSTAMPDDGSTAMPDDGSTAMPDDGSTAMPDDGSTAMPDDGSTAMPDDGSTAMPDDEQMTDDSTPAPAITVSNVEQYTVAEAARHAPVAGSVTQSSDAGSDDITRDAVSVMITRSGGSLNVDAFYNGSKVVSTTDATESPDVEDVLDRPKGTHLYERVEQGQGVEFYRSLRSGDVQERDGTAVPAGDLWVDIYTDYAGDGDTDYLAGGIWVYVPDDATSLDDYEYGAFADGNDPFVQSNLASLTGTATYVAADGATGVYAEVESQRNYFFDADVTLTADFGSGSELGTIGGRIHRFDIEGVNVIGNPVLNLNSAPIGTSNHGFFKGGTHLTYDGESYTGNWGGQFYGNGEADGKPGSVAGTFGAATTDGSESLLGAFGAFKQ